MKAFVAVGSNLGPSRRTLGRAIRLLDGQPGISVDRVSPLYRTQPVGGPLQPDYFNGVVELRTHLKPSALLGRLLTVERELGRVRRKKWGPRNIDLDLLTYGRRRVKQPGLTIPHPRYHQRRFVLVPFCYLAPNFVHPIFRRQNSALLAKLTPQGQRVTIDAQWNGTRFTPSKSRKRTTPRS